MRTRIAILSVAAWAMGSMAAQAFEQTPLAPPPAAPVTAPAQPQLQPQSKLSFGAKIKKAEPKKKVRSFKLPGIGKLAIPKLNFGLDLMYGSSESDDSGLGFSADPATDDDLTILGTFKRRF